MNNLTLICDMNYVLMSRFSVVGGFEKGSPERTLQIAQQNLTDMLARSINIMINRFPMVDNIILVGDGGSWRKQLNIPDQLKDITYKGNREKNDTIDWHHVFGALNDLMKNARNNNITVSQTLSAEGDDWVWYWSKKLNSQGVNTLIWSIDRDLQQLVQKNEDGVFTAWYSDRSGLCLPENCMERKKFDPIDFFMSPLEYSNQLIDKLKTCSGNKVAYVNPDEIVIEKVLCGDSGDNIKAIVRYDKGGRTYRFSEGDLKKYQEHDLPMSTVEDLKECKEDIANWVVNNKKYKPYHIKKNDVLEMLDYNIKLVWLSEETIPKPVIQSMNEVEYKQFDVNTLRSNYKILAKTNEDNDIENIFEEIQ